MKDPIFIVGLPRTGSTLWHNIFAKNEFICRIGEMHFLTPVRKDFKYFIKNSVGDLSKDENISKMFDLLLSGERLKGISDGFWTIELKDIPDASLKDNLVKRTLESDRSVESIFKAIIEEYTAYKQKTQSCIKFPLYVNHIPELAEWYPGCKIVHITRDPRAIAVSRKNDPAGTRKKVQKYPYLAWFIKKIMVSFVVFQYVWSSRLHVTYQRKYKNYRLFKYEDLLSDPRRTIEELCEHTGIDFNEDMLNPGKGQASSITDKKKEGFDSSAAFRWKKHITTFENRMITLFTRSSMRRFDYNPKSASYLTGL